MKKPYHNLKPHLKKSKNAWEGWKATVYVQGVEVSSCAPNMKHAYHGLIGKLLRYGDECAGGAGGQINPRTGKYYGDMYYQAAVDIGFK